MRPSAELTDLGQRTTDSGMHMVADAFFGLLFVFGAYLEQSERHWQDSPACAFLSSIQPLALIEMLAHRCRVLQARPPMVPCNG